MRVAVGLDKFHPFRVVIPMVTCEQYTKHAVEERTTTVSSRRGLLSASARPLNIVYLGLPEPFVMHPFQPSRHKIGNP